MLSYVVRKINKLYPKPEVNDPVTAYATHERDGQEDTDHCRRKSARNIRGWPLQRLLRC